MRNSELVQRAHDILHAIVAGEAPNPFPEDEIYTLRALHDFLSWVLEGPCGQPFANNMENCVRELKARGFELVRLR